MVRHRVANVLVVSETHWDRKQLQACWPSWGDRFEIVYSEPDHFSCSNDLDLARFVGEVTGGRWGRIDAVISTSDYPGAMLSSVIAQQLELPGPSPESVLTASHRWYSRRAQREAAPEAVPAFKLIDPSCLDAIPELPFPWYIKPVVGTFPGVERDIRNERELRQHLTSARVQHLGERSMQIFNQLIHEFTPFDIDGAHVLAEEVLVGNMAIVEGYVQKGSIEFLGIVDAVMHPETGCLVRFDYPSRLHPHIGGRMLDIARRVVRRLGLEDTLFHVELMWDEMTNRIVVTQVSPHMCAQFADLYQKVDGTSSYEVALALALGERPVVMQGQGRHAFAASVPLCASEPCSVVRAPTARDLADAESMYPDTIVWSDCFEGDLFSPPNATTHPPPIGSHYAILNVGANDPPSLEKRIQSIEERLGFAFASRPVASTTHDASMCG